MSWKIQGGKSSVKALHKELKAQFKYALKNYPRNCERDLLDIENMENVPAKLAEFLSSGDSEQYDSLKWRISNWARRAYINTL